MPKPALNPRYPIIVPIRDPRDVVMSWCYWSEHIVKKKNTACDEAWFYEHINCTIRNVALFHYW
jgi:hypothetical protein